MLSILIRLSDHEIFRAFRQIFEFQHLLPLVIVVVVMILFLHFQKALKSSKKFQSYFREALGYVLVFAPLLETWLAASRGSADWRTELPFHALWIVSFFMGLILWKRNKRGFDCCSYLSIIIAVFHLLFPSYQGDAFSFRYILYYMTSLSLLLSVVYLHIVDQMKFNTLGLRRSLFCTQIFVTAILGLNLLMGTDYWYLLQAPSSFWSPLMLLSTNLLRYLIGYLFFLYGSYGVLYAIFHRKQILVFYRAKLGEKKA